MMLTIFLILVVSLSNFWIYWIFKYNFLIGELLIIETTLLVFSVFPGKSKSVSVLSIAIIFFLGMYLLMNHFDKNLFSVSTIESIRINQRQSFYAYELGRIYQNRIGLIYFDNLRIIFGKMSENLFSALDLSLYFFTGLISEHGKISAVFSPLFLSGILFIIKNIKKIPIIYLLIALLVNVFIRLDSKLGPLIMFPFIIFCIIIGLVKIIEKIRGLFPKT